MFWFILGMPYRAHWQCFSVILSKIKISLKIKAKMIHRILDGSDRADSKTLTLMCILGTLEQN